MDQSQNIDEIDNLSEKILKTRKNLKDMEIVLKKLEDEQKYISEAKLYLKLFEKEGVSPALLTLDRLTKPKMDFIKSLLLLCKVSPVKEIFEKILSDDQESIKIITFFQNEIVEKEKRFVQLKTDRFIKF